MNELSEWLKDTLDSQKSPSFGRASAGFVIYFLVVWGCYIVSKTAIIPEIPFNWIALVGILWGSSAAKEAYTKGKEILNNVNPSTS